MAQGPVTAFAVTGLLVAAGCISPAADLVGAGLVPDLTGLTTEALWHDPQNTPHPAYGWPTLSSPARDLPHSLWAPIAAAPLPDTVAGITHETRVDGVGRGAGIALFGSLAVVPGYGPASHIVDISEPAAPVVLSAFKPAQGPQRGAAIIAHPDGALTTVLATSAGFEVWNITDPEDPTHLVSVAPPRGGHKLGVVPGTPIVYNADSSGGGRTTEGGGGRFEDDGKGVTPIYDLTDPANPVHVQDFANGFGCHHIYFWSNGEKHRALCAGVQFTQIWDIADPLEPEVIVSVPVVHGVRGTPSLTGPIVTPFSHFAGLNAAGDVLLVGDEWLGGGIPPGCIAAANEGERHVSTPLGALWFYDVSDESNPRLQGYFAMDYRPEPAHPTWGCTAHHGRLVPDAAGRDLVAMGFYNQGVVLIDFTDPANPWLVDQHKDQSVTWEAWYYNGHLFTGDLARGMDVYTVR